MLSYYLQTDSLAYVTETGYIYEDFYEDRNLFEDSKFLILSIENFGKMKDKAVRKVISEFVWLKSNVYSLVIEDIKMRKLKKQKVSKNILLKT